MSSNILYTTIAGWGQVSSVDDAIATVLAVDNGAGEASLSVTTPATLSTDEIGAQVWIEGLTGLVDGYYTLYNLIPVAGNAIAFISGDPANFSLSTGANPAIIRIEDFYKISSGIPDWVVGTNARARWYNGMMDSSPSLGTELNIKGGEAKTDGITITHNAMYLGLDKVRWNTMAASTGSSDFISIRNTVYTQDTDTWGTYLGIPYMNSYNNPSTAPADGVYEPTFVAGECVRADSATGAFPNYNVEFTRALLNTERDQHIYGELFFDGFTSPISRRGGLYELAEGSAQYFDANTLFEGLITGIGYGDGVTYQTIQMSDNLFEIKKRAALGSTEATAKWDYRLDYFNIEQYRDNPNYFNTISINQAFRGYYWKWIKVDSVAVRLVTSPEEEPNAGGALEQDYFQASSAGEYYGRVRSQQPVYKTPISNGKPNILTIEKITNPQDWVKANVAYEPSRDGLIDFDSEEEGLAYYVHPEHLITYIPADTVIPGQGGAFIGPTALQELSSDISPCHVFERIALTDNADIPWPDSSGGFLDAPPAERWVTVNPIEVLLAILLTKWGQGENTFTYNGDTYDFDYLPPEIGVGIDAGRLDIGSFMRVAEFFELNNIKLTNAFIESKDTEKLSKWISDNILEPFLLSICVSTNNKIKLTSLADSRFKRDLFTLNNSTLYRTPSDDGEPVEYTLDGSNVIDSIKLKFDRPWLSPTAPESSKVVNFRYGVDGLSRQFNTISQNVLAPKIKFAPMFADVGFDTLANYYGPYLTNLRTPIIVITAYVYDTYGGIPGDYVLVDLDNVPNSVGTSATNLQGIGLVTSRKKDVLSKIDQIEVYIVNTFNLNLPRGWAASGNVASVSSSTVFDLETTTYSYFFDSDSASFNEGDFVLLYDENFVLKSFDGAGNPGPKQIDTISSDTITLTSAWTDNSLSSISPAVGDIMLLAQENLQTAGTAEDYMYIYNDPGERYPWQ